MHSLGYTPKNRELLISPIFKSTFTLSGGPNLAFNYLEGDQSLRGNHYIHQPCIRHWDSPQVGDGKHLSFFNMLVTTSIEGFDRKIVFSHHLDYIKNHLGLDVNKIHATYFGGGDIKGTKFKADIEAKNIWLELGIPEARLIACEDENLMEAFVANSIEPVGGYRSELFYNINDNNPKSADDFFKLEKKGEMLEFWTHVDYICKVFVDENNNYSFEKFETPVHAAGFGPQRVMRILENVNCIEDISIFDRLKRCFPQTKDKQARSVVMDHMRGLVFLINDGAADLKGKKNRSRKYVFRKYIQHLMDNLDKIVKSDNRNRVITCLVDESISLFSILFPEFITRRNEILRKTLELLG
jgi:alanyl-tRNA synthetase